MMRLWLFLFFFCVLALPVKADQSPLRIVASFSILGDIAQHVGGNLVTVKTLVGPDADAHAYKPAPQDSIAILQADMVIENGLGFEGWMGRIVAASGYKGITAVASDGVQPLQMNDDGHVITDPHAWQNVANARVYAKNIAAALKKAMPAKAAQIDAQAKAYDDELQKLDSWVKAQIANVPEAQRKIITSHDAFGYFASAYHVTFMAPQGISTESEPSARQVAKLIDQMKVEKVKTVFFESMASPKLVKQLAQEAGAQVGDAVYSDALSGAGGPAPDYVAMMHHNVEQFRMAMQHGP